MKQLTVSQFGKLYKEKHPEALNMNDRDISEMFVRKNPQFANRISFDKDKVSEYYPQAGAEVQVNKKLGNLAPVPLNKQYEAETGINSFKTYDPKKIAKPVSNIDTSGMTQIQKNMLEIAHNPTLSKERKEYEIRRLGALEQERFDTQELIKQDARNKLMQDVAFKKAHPIRSSLNEYMNPVHNSNIMLLNEYAKYGTKAPTDVKAKNLMARAGAGLATSLADVAPFATGMGLHPAAAFALQGGLSELGRGVASTTMGQQTIEDAAKEVGLNTAVGAIGGAAMKPFEAIAAKMVLPQANKIAKDLMLKSGKKFAPEVEQRLTDFIRQRMLAKNLPAKMGAGALEGLGGSAVDASLLGSGEYAFRKMKGEDPNYGEVMASYAPLLAMGTGFSALAPGLGHAFNKAAKSKIVNNNNNKLGNLLGETANGLGVNAPTKRSKQYQELGRAKKDFDAQADKKYDTEKNEAFENIRKFNKDEKEQMEDYFYTGESSKKVEEPTKTEPPKTDVQDENVDFTNNVFGDNKISRQSAKLKEKKQQNSVEDAQKQELNEQPPTYKEEPTNSQKQDISTNKEEVSDGEYQVKTSYNKRTKIRSWTKEALEYWKNRVKQKTILNGEKVYVNADTGKKLTEEELKQIRKEVDDFDKKVRKKKSKERASGGESYTVETLNPQHIKTAHSISKQTTDNTVPLYDNYKENKVRESDYLTSKTMNNIKALYDYYEDEKGVLHVTYKKNGKEVVGTKLEILRKKIKKELEQNKKKLDKETVNEELSNKREEYKASEEDLEDASLSKNKKLDEDSKHSNDIEQDVLDNLEEEQDITSTQAYQKARNRSVVSLTDEGAKFATTDPEFINFWKEYSKPYNTDRERKNILRKYTKNMSKEEMNDFYEKVSDQEIREADRLAKDKASGKRLDEEPKELGVAKDITEIIEEDKDFFDFKKENGSIKFSKKQDEYLNSILVDSINNVKGKNIHNSKYHKNGTKGKPSLGDLVFHRKRTLVNPLNGEKIVDEFTATPEERIAMIAKLSKEGKYSQESFQEIYDEIIKEIEGKSPAPEFTQKAFNTVNKAFKENLDENMKLNYKTFNATEFYSGVGKDLDTKQKNAIKNYNEIVYELKQTTYKKDPEKYSLLLTKLESAEQTLHEVVGEGYNIIKKNNFVFTKNSQIRKVVNEHYEISAIAAEAKIRRLLLNDKPNEAWDVLKEREKVIYNNIYYSYEKTPIQDRYEHLGSGYSNAERFAPDKKLKNVDDRYDGNGDYKIASKTAQAKIDELENAIKEHKKFVDPTRNDPSDFVKENISDKTFTPDMYGKEIKSINDFITDYSKTATKSQQTFSEINRGKAIIENLKKLNKGRDGKIFYKNAESNTKILEIDKNGNIHIDPHKMSKEDFAEALAHYGYLESKGRDTSNLVFHSDFKQTLGVMHQIEHNNIKDLKEINLDKIIDLYPEYSSLRGNGFKIKVVDDLDMAGGYSTKDKTLYINKGVSADSGRTFYHEIQHAIDEQLNPEEFKKALNLSRKFRTFREENKDLVKRYTDFLSEGNWKYEGVVLNKKLKQHFTDKEIDVIKKYQDSYNEYANCYIERRAYEAGKNKRNFSEKDFKTTKRTSFKEEYKKHYRDNAEERRTASRDVKSNTDNVDLAEYGEGLVQEKDIKDMPTKVASSLRNISQSVENKKIELGLINPEQALNRKKQLAKSINADVNKIAYVEQKTNPKPRKSLLNLLRNYEEIRKQNLGKLGKAKYGVRNAVEAEDIATNLFTEEIKVNALKNIRDVVRKNFAEPVVDGKIKKGYVEVNEQLLMKAMYNHESVKWYEAIAGGEESIRKTFVKESKDVHAKYKEIYLNSKGENVKTYQIPENVLKKLLDGSAENVKESIERYGINAYSLGKGVQAFTNFYTNMFKKAVLPTATFIVNNPISNELLMLMHSSNMAEFVRGAANATKIEKKYIPQEILENNIAKAVDESTKRVAYTGYQKIDNVLNILNGQPVETQHLKEMIKSFKEKKDNKRLFLARKKLAKAEVANIFGMPMRVYNNIADKMLKINSKLEDIQRFQIYGHEVEKVRKDLIKKTSQNMVTLEETLKHIESHPELKETLVRKIEDTLGDYNNFTSTEKNVIKNIIPFYSWFRTISRSFIKLAKENPSRLATVMYLHNKIVESQDDLKSFQRGSIRTGIKDPRSGKELLINKMRQTPFASVTELGESSAYPGMVNPLIRVPIEAAKGKKFFASGEIKNKRYVNKYVGKDDEGKPKYKYYDVKKNKYIDSLPASTRLGYAGKELTKPFIPYLTGNSMIKGESLLTGVANTKKRGEFLEPDSIYDADWGGYYKDDVVGKTYSKKGNKDVKRYVTNNLSQETKFANRLGLSLQNKYDLNKAELKARKQKLDKEKAKRLNKRMKEDK